MKITKSYRIEEYIVKELEKIVKETGINATKIVEMAVIEKIQRMRGIK